MKSRRTLVRLALSAAAILSICMPAGAARISIVNADGPGEGFNDPTVVTPVVGNAGTTRGEQRLNVMEAVANYWGARLGSDVEIVVEATMDSLSCTPTSAVLGNAGSGAFLANFTNAPRPNTWFPVPVASSHAESDLCPPAGPCGDSDDINATFNKDVDDDPNCLSTRVWWYGIGADAPAGTISFFNTVLHEFGHGLGFATIVDLATGTEPSGIPDIFETHLEDHSLGLLWPAMDDAQRMNSAIDSEDLHWVGDCVAPDCGFLDTGAIAGGHVNMYAPNPLELGSSVSHWDKTLSPDELMEPTATPFIDARLTRKLFRDITWRQIVLAVRAVGDVNANMSEDIAVLVTDFVTRQNAVRIVDGQTGAVVSNLIFTKAFFPVGMERVSDFGGTPADEVAVLLQDVDGLVRIMVKDASSGALLSTVNFSAAWQPLQFEVMSSFGGTAAPELALLAVERGSSRRVRVFIKDASSGLALNDVFFSKLFLPIDLEIVSDFGGTQAEELALLARSCANQMVIVDVKDGSNDARLNKLFFSKVFTPLDMEVVPDLDGGSPTDIGGTLADEISVLGRRFGDKFVKVRTKDAGNAFQHSEINFSSALEPLDLEVVPSFGDTTASEIALLFHRRDNGQNLVKIKDVATGISLSNLSYPLNREPRDLAVLPNWTAGLASEVAVYSVRYRDSEKRVVIYDGDGVLISSIAVP